MTSWFDLLIYYFIIKSLYVSFIASTDLCVSLPLSSRTNFYKSQGQFSLSVISLLPERGGNVAGRVVGGSWRKRETEVGKNNLQAEDLRGAKVAEDAWPHYGSGSHMRKRSEFCWVPKFVWQWLRTIPNFTSSRSPKDRRARSFSASQSLNRRGLLGIFRRLIQLIIQLTAQNFPNPRAPTEEESLWNIS